jgi:hypothetical protein
MEFKRQIGFKFRLDTRNWFAAVEMTWEAGIYAVVANAITVRI